MTDHVRVRDNETGHHYSIPRERYDLTPSVWTELKQDATNAAGEPLPAKYKTSPSTEAEKKAGSTATEKENH